MMKKMNWEKRAALAKPCPFCGSKRVVTETKDNFYYGNMSCTYIKCLNCGAILFGEVVNENGSYERTYNEAQRIVLKMWNRRAS